VKEQELLVEQSLAKLGRHDTMEEQFQIKGTTWAHKRGNHHKKI
jgi:hypothetical protein